MGTYTSRHLFAQMLLLSISSFGVESSWAPDVVCTFDPPKAWNVRPGTGNSSLVFVSFCWEWRYIELVKQWSHHQKGSGNEKHGYGAAEQRPLARKELCRIVSLENMGHLMNTANTKAVTVTVELITTCWAPRINCPCQQDLPSAKNYPYTCTTSTFAGLSWCKKYWTYLHVSICVWHNVFFLGTHLQSLASPPIFCRFAIVIWKWFEHISISGQRCLWSAPYDMIKNVPPAFFVHMTWYGSNLGLHKIGRLKMI